MENVTNIKKLKIDPNAEEVLKLRYYVDKANGEKENSFSELCRRVSKTVASAEVLYTKSLTKIINLEKNIYNDMLNHKFLFNSPALFSSAAGLAKNAKFSDLVYKDPDDMTIDEYEYIYNNKTRNQMLFACFVIEVEDSLEDIFDSVKNAAVISKFGGGVGANFSHLREKSYNISGGTGGQASGPVSFMETWNTMGSVVVQGGKRRAALMGMLNSNHPDVEEFINCKTEDGKLQYFNVSVAIDDAFMKAIADDEEYDLISPYSHEVAKTVKARELWDKICNNAHKRGDPGIFFIDNANNDSLLQGLKDYQIESTNPCVTGDTLIATADGRNSVPIKQLAEENKDIPVYCINNDGNMDIKVMRNPRITGYDSEVYELLLDDGSKIKATSNHKFRLHDGSYKELGSLVPGDSLWIGEKKKLAFHENFYDEVLDPDTKKYWCLNTKNGKVAEHHLIHNFYNNKPIYEKIAKDYNIHHIDYNQYNNRIENLLLCTASDHHKIYHNISGENNPVNKHPECNWRNDPAAQQKMREEHHIGAKRSEETKRNIGATTKDRFDNDEEFRKRHSAATKAAMTDEVKQKISDNKKEYYHSLVNEKLAKCQEQTDLKCIVIENTIYVEKHCEECGKLFTVPFSRREVATCSKECNGKMMSKRLLGSTISESARETIDLKKEKLREAQVKVYSDLKFELGKDPMKKEWFAKCKELGISTEIARKSSPFRKYKDLKVAALSYNHKVVSVTYIGKEDVYNGTVDDYHNLCFILSASDNNYKTIVNSLQCGEQPLSNFSSCNLGSINLAEFVEPENKVFKWDEFIDIIHRTMYYLDLIIDASEYPLERIRNNTLASRPVGLGVMGLADAAILLGIKYGSDEFYEFSRNIAKALAGESLLASIQVSYDKGPFDLWNKEFEDENEINAQTLIRNIANFNKKIKTLDDCIATHCTLVKKTSDDELYENKLTSIITALYYLIQKAENKRIDEKIVIKAFNTIFFDKDKNIGLRNSRRLSIAPTGTISLLLGTSSSIEPNFAYEWNRLVNINETEKQELTYYHKLNNEENKKAGLLIAAHEITPMEHVEVVKCFAPYIDSAISKTVNLPEEATVADVKKVYEECFKYSIKGITVYRDGSRSFQPIQKKEEEKEIKTESVDDKVSEAKLGIPIKKRNQFMSGTTTKCSSPFGSIYVTVNFDSDGLPFEVFVSAGKSGSISKSITEALSRVISLALRAGVSIDDIVKTMDNISGSEAWIYDKLNNDDVIVRSIPDTIAKMLKDLVKYNSLNVKQNNIAIEANTDTIEHKNDIICPECGNVMVMEGSCSICYFCGYSPCK